MTSWIDNAKQLHMEDIADRLDLEKSTSTGTISFQCPACRALTRHPKRKDKRGAVGLTPDGQGWRCFECDAKGDVVDLAAYTLAGTRLREASAEDLELVRQWFMERWPFIADRPPQRSQTDSTSPRYPPSEELKALWSSSIPAGEDKDARAWVWNRLVPTTGHRQERDVHHNQVLEAIMNQDLARAIRLNADRPTWLRHTDNRLILPLYNGMGQLRSCKVRPLPGPEGKGYSPKNFDAAGLVFANTTARDMLGQHDKPAGWPEDEPFRLIVCEGEVDWMTWCVHDELGAGDARETPPPAIIGVFSGSWTQALAERVPDGTYVIIRNDRDEKGTGERYARKAFELLGNRCNIRWLGPSDGTDMPDDNDLFIADKLPADPAEDTELMKAEGETDPLEGLRTRLRQGSMAMVGERAAAWLRGVASGELQPVDLPWEGLKREHGGGLFPGAHVLVGNPKAGKSQFALQLAFHAARSGSPTSYVALELGDEQVWTRTLGIASGRKWSRLALGEGSNPVAEIQELLERYQADLADLPMHIIHGEAKGWDGSELRALPNLLRELHPNASRPPLVIVDFLQLVQSKALDIRERIAQIAYTARMTARESAAALLLVSSTARDNYGRLDKGIASKRQKADTKEEPQMGEGTPGRFIGLGKESGEIELSADSVMVLLRGKHEDAQHQDGSLIWLAMAGIRARPEGATGWVAFRFNGGWFTEEPTPPTDEDLEEELNMGRHDRIDVAKRRMGS